MSYNQDKLKLVRAGKKWGLKFIVLEVQSPDRKETVTSVEEQKFNTGDKELVDYLEKKG